MAEIRAGVYRCYCKVCLGNHYGRTVFSYHCHNGSSHGKHQVVPDCGGWHPVLELAFVLCGGKDDRFSRVTHAGCCFVSWYFHDFQVFHTLPFGAFPFIAFVAVVLFGSYLVPAVVLVRLCFALRVGARDAPFCIDYPVCACSFRICAGGVGDFKRRTCQNPIVHFP